MLLNTFLRVKILWAHKEVDMAKATHFQVRPSRTAGMFVAARLEADGTGAFPGLVTVDGDHLFHSGEDAAAAASGQGLEPWTGGVQHKHQTPPLQHGMTGEGMN